MGLSPPLGCVILHAVICGACAVGGGAYLASNVGRPPISSVVQWGGIGCRDVHRCRRLTIRGGNDERNDESGEQRGEELDAQGAKYVPGMMQQEVRIP